METGFAQSDASTSLGSLCPGHLLADDIDEGEDVEMSEGGLEKKPKITKEEVMQKILMQHYLRLLLQ